MDIKTLKAEGHSQRAVARILGLHRDTVQRVWDEATPSKYTREPRPKGLSLLVGGGVLLALGALGLGSTLWLGGPDPSLWFIISGSGGQEISG